MNDKVKELEKYASFLKAPYPSKIDIFLSKMVLIRS